MLVMVSVELPVLVSIVVRVLELRPGRRRLGARLNFTTVPVPLKLAVCGLPGALSVIDNVEVWVPISVGSKVTSIVQLAPAARLNRLSPQVFAV
jgi:hypothetical protein